MRRFGVLLYTMLAFVSAKGQSFTPFSVEGSKRFVNVNDPQDSMYYFHSEGSWEANDTLYFRQYARLGDLESTEGIPECQPWGDQVGFSIEPLWTGRQFAWHAPSGQLTFHNEEGALLQFDLGLAVGDSSAFFTTEQEAYFIKCISQEEESVFGVADEVKNFSIRAYDLFGNLVSTLWDEHIIRLSEDFGLLSFIDAFHFPATQVALNMVGQSLPALGYYQMTYDELFPWQVGDTLEYSGHNPGPQSGVYTNSYQLIVITDRVETADTVWIYYNEQIEVDPNPDDFPGGPILMNYSNPIVFRKGAPVISLPVGGTEDSGATLREEDFEYCGTRRRYKLEGDWIHRCEECDCFIAVDGFGNYINVTSYVEGLGILSVSSEPYGAPWGNASVGLIYSSVGGISCGTFQPIHVVEEMENDISVFPNPTEGVVRIESSKKLESVTVYDVFGRHLLTEGFKGNVHTIDLTSWAQGSYVIYCKYTDGLMARATVIKI